MKSRTPMKKPKVLQTFGKEKIFKSPKNPKKSIIARNIDKKTNFFFCESLKNHIFFRTFHHKFLQSLFLLDKFSYNILTHTNLSLEKRHGTKNSTWIFAEIYRQFWTRKGCTRLGSGTSNGLHRSFTTGFSRDYAPNL